MAAGIPAGLSDRAAAARQGRRFGLTVGAAFLVLAAVTQWRGRATAAALLGTLGGLLVLAGLAVPAQLLPVERLWMRLAAAISKVTTPIVMAAMYFLVLTPTGLLRRAFGRNPLVRDSRSPGFWVVREPDQCSDLERQF